MGSLVLADLHPIGMFSEPSSFDKLYAHLDRSHPNLIVIVGHDCDIYQDDLWAVHAFGGKNLGDPDGKIPASFEAARLPPEKIRSPEQQEAAYQQLRNCCSTWFRREKDPSIQIVTCNELYDKSSRPIARLTPGQKSTQSLKSWPGVRIGNMPVGVRPPNFIRLAGPVPQYVTLAEAFGLLCAALAYYTDHGKFPEELPGRELLGPVELLDEVDPISAASGDIPARSILTTAREIYAGISDRLPLMIELDSLGLKLNTAEFLFLMACVVARLGEGAHLADLAVP